MATKPRRKRRKITKSFPQNSLLYGLDDIIWDAIAHVDPKYFNTKGKRKQVAIREALNKIGLGWVDTSTYPHRTVVGDKFNNAEKMYKKNGWRPPESPLPELKRVEVEDKEWVPLNLEENLSVDGTQYTNEAGEICFKIVRDGCTDTECLFPASVSSHINTSVEQTGMAVIRKAVDGPTIEKLLVGNDNDGSHPDASKLEEVDEHSRLLFTNGNGIAGEETFMRHTSNKPFSSYYSDLDDSTYLSRMQNIIVRSLKEECSNMNDVDEYRKYIVLKYSKGGENWAHCDANNDGFFPYQALLMLSNGDEYDGGQFYVTKCSSQNNSNDGRRISFLRTICPNLNAGDLVIFRADVGGGYHHGMTTVTRGERVAVGLLQPT